MSQIQDIINALNTKLCIKQDVYKLTMEMFKSIRKNVDQIVEEIGASDGFDSEKVPLEIYEESDFEFHLKIGGDLVAFIMQTNVFAFPSAHDIFKQKYIKQDRKRAYFGQVMVYNYIADSIKYNRMYDVGYLIERLFVNIDNHFYVEGLSNLNFSYLDVSKNTLNDEILKQLVEKAILVAINTDLVTSSFQENFKLTVEQKRINRSANLGTKVGFQMRNNDQ